MFREPEELSLEQNQTSALWYGNESSYDMQTEENAYQSTAQNKHLSIAHNRGRIWRGQQAYNLPYLNQSRSCRMTVKQTVKQEGREKEGGPKCLP